MKKSELISALEKEHSYLHKSQIEDLVNLTFKQFSECLANKQKIEIRGFGVFSSRGKKVQKNFYNADLNSIDFIERNAVHFKIGKDFLNRLNNLK